MKTAAVSVLQKAKSIKVFWSSKFFKNAGGSRAEPSSPSAGSPSMGESAERISTGVRADGETPCATLIARGEMG